ncbi:hypothetical protein G6M04_15940 [Agrobacterium rhizogenes]|uniref:hypothetical protein n=1 Tax=Rhizobium rhizogenes TaxID=359 RepID=UPI0015744094|nr:hypothetical protein [Rhizobium rhizogenes]NTG48873.1 hypothetical protein [Rhizobium rhizogenes]
MLEAVHNCFGAGRKPAFTRRESGARPQIQDAINHFREFEKMHVYKDLWRETVNRKILRDCNKKAKKQMTKLIL